MTDSIGTTTFAAAALCTFKRYSPSAVRLFSRMYSPEGVSWPLVAKRGKGEMWRGVAGLGRRRGVVT